MAENSAIKSKLDRKAIFTREMYIKNLVANKISGKSHIRHQTMDIKCDNSIGDHPPFFSDILVNNGLKFDKKPYNTIHNSINLKKGQIMHMIK